MIKFTQTSNEELGFYLFETFDQDGTWRIEARFPHQRNDINAEIIIEQDVCSPRETFDQAKLLKKLDFLINLYNQYVKGT